LDEVRRLAGGRRHYHAMRRLQRDLRRHKVTDLLAQHGLGPGVQARISRELGLSQATISRDVDAILLSSALCTCCGTLVPKDWVEHWEKRAAGLPGR
jgi:hypothetical protein